MKVRARCTWLAQEKTRNISIIVAEFKSNCTQAKAIYSVRLCTHSKIIAASESLSVVNATFSIFNHFKSSEEFFPIQNDASRHAGR